MLVLSQSPKPYSKDILLAPGKTRIEFKSDAKIFGNGDPRNIVFGIYNYKITDPTR
jgi:hypothetical protein